MTSRRISRDEWLLGIATAAAKIADCTRSQVAAVLMRADYSIAGIGYNGAPRGMPGCLTAGACPRGQLSKNELPSLSSYDTGPGACIAIHAEQNAMAGLRESAAGMTLGVTREPCHGCWKMLGAYPLERVVWLDEHGRINNNHKENAA